MPEITDVSQALQALSGSANAANLQGIDATILFDISGQEGGQWTVIIKDGRVDVAEGITGPASVTVEAAAKDIKALVKGDLKPMAAFMQGRLKVKGDMSLVMQLQKLFG